MTESPSLSVFFALLRYGLWGKEAGSDAAALPADINWTEVFHIARTQAVLGIVLQGLSFLPERRLPPSKDRIDLMVEVGRITLRSEKVKSEAEGLIGMFRNEGLHPIVQKGPDAAKHYPAPSYRTSGDIDIFFDDSESATSYPVSGTSKKHTSEFSSALAIINSLGPRVERESDGSYVYNWQGIAVEHHPRYFDIHVKAGKLPPVPSPEAELLMLSAHILKHSIGAGVGLRQFCDIAEAFTALNGEYDKAKLAFFIDGCGLRRWNNLLCSFLVELLGVSTEALPAFGTVRIKRLQDIVLSGGNFGQRRNGKLGTAAAFLRQLPYSLGIAPKETLCTMIELIRGNIWGGMAHFI